MTMNATMRMLKVSREARRDAVVRRLNEANAAHGAALASHQQALQAVAFAQSARGELDQSMVLTADASWRLSLRDSCDALVQHRMGLMTVAANTVTDREVLVNEQRAALNACERALMRNDEWAAHMREEEQRAQRLDEQSQDDDLAAAMKPRDLTTGRPLSCKA
jgi:hypothetical protein